MGQEERREDDVWATVMGEAQAMAAESTDGLDDFAAEILPMHVDCSILRWSSLEEAVAHVLSGKLAGPSPGEQKRFHGLLNGIFSRGETENEERIGAVMRSDLKAIKERDPACPGLAHALLFFKGFQGIQVHRAANVLWRRGQRSLASLLQSRASEVFAMDIHPAARIGSRVMVDHATGVVIGETAVVGDGCTLLHSITLGGTGKDSGDRHPKLGKNVLVGAGAKILGNVKIGDGAKIGAAAVVLSNIPAHATAIGAPAKVVGKSVEENPASSVDVACRRVASFKSKDHFACPFRHLQLHNVHAKLLDPYDFARHLQDSFHHNVPAATATMLFFELDKDQKGHISIDDFKANYDKIKAFVGLNKNDVQESKPTI